MQRQNTARKNTGSSRESASSWFTPGRRIRNRLRATHLSPSKNCTRALKKRPLLAHGDSQQAAVAKKRNDRCEGAGKGANEKERLAVLSLLLYSSAIREIAEGGNESRIPAQPTCAARFPPKTADRRVSAAYYSACSRFPKLPAPSTRRKHSFGPMITRSASRIRYG